jgi:hypothetical protein
MITTDTSAQHDAHDAAAPRSSSRGRTVFLTAVGVLVGAGLTAGIVLGFGGASAAAAPVPGATGSASSWTAPATDGDAHHALAPGGGSGTHHVTPQPPAVPSAAIETLQRELGQLNYYEGPITGTMTPQTVQAIDYLQRDAKLPQTGTMNTATQTALASLLAHGNNQMGS